MRSLAAEPLAPTRLNLVLTGAPPAGAPPYALWVADGFDLAHCAVALGVDARTGAWRFDARERNCRALMERRLEALPECFARRGRCAASALRLVAFMDLGFTLDGDGDWADEGEARAALRAVAA